jgi:Beta-galactosidase
MYGNQMVCGWTWQSMWAGEEQYLQGMLDWDGVPNRKYDEYKKIATEFKKIEKFFPYKPRPEVAIALSFPSQIASSSFPEQHESQVQSCWNLFYWRNMDANIVEISKSNLKYKILLVPGITVMDEKTATKIREFVTNGGTVIMTSNSALVDETGQVFKTGLPGRLSDVFGIRVSSYEETEPMNEISRKSYTGKKLSIGYLGNNFDVESARYDVIAASNAEVIANITSLDKDYPIITMNKFGKGTAYYVGIPANETVLNPLLDELIDKLNITKGPDVPKGVMARQIDEKHILYLNVSGQSQTIKLNRKSRSLLSDREYDSIITIPAYEPEFVELK